MEYMKVGAWGGGNVRGWEDWRVSEKDSKRMER